MASRKEEIDRQLEEQGWAEIDQVPEVPKLTKKDERNIKGWIAVERSDDRRMLGVRAWAMSVAPTPKVGRRKGSNNGNEERDAKLVARMKKIIGKTDMTPADAAKILSHKKDVGFSRHTLRKIWYAEKKRKG